jgi:phosphoenolpyruvate carboxylase
VREPTQTEAIDLVGRFEAGQEIPESMRADVRMLGALLGRVLRESGSAGLFEDVERLRVATIEAYTDETPAAFARAKAIADSFTVQRADEVARAVQRLLARPREELRRAALRAAATFPTSEEHFENLFALYARLLAQRAARGCGAAATVGAHGVRFTHTQE